MSNQTKAAGGLSDPGRIKEVLSRHGFHFSKALGQNFLINPTVCPRMAQACGAGDCKGVIEVGPGIGVLTWELSQVAEKVCAIELDSRLFPRAGGDSGRPGQRENHPRRCDEAGFGPAHPRGVRGRPGVCVRQPALLHHLPGDSPPAGGAPAPDVHHGDGAEGGRRPAVCRPRLQGVRRGERGGALPQQAQVLFPVGRGSFMPPPKVDSAVIRLDVLQQPPVAVEDEKWFFQVARGAFAQRRKTAANSISATLGVPKPQVEQALLAAGVAANIRAERLTLEQLAALAGALGESLPLASRGKTV